MDESGEALDDLRARVSRLEALVGDGTPAETGPDGTALSRSRDAATFWVLEALDQRGLDPAVVFGGTTHDADGAPVRWQITRDADDLLRSDWSEVVPALAALGHPSRLQILQLVAQGEARTAAELAAAEGLGTTGQIYHHLRQLVAGGWLRATARGQHTVPAERLVPLLVVLAAAARS